MSNVISLIQVLEERRESRNVQLSYEDIVERILHVSHKHVSLGAVVLLHHIAYLVHKGHPHLSYTYLCARIGVARATLASYLDELETAEMVRIVRARKDAKLNQPNFFAIDFNGPLGDDMSKLKLPKNPNKMGSSKIEPPQEGVVQKLNGYISNTNKSKRISKDIQALSAPQFDTVSEALAASEKRVTRKRAETVAKALKPGSQLTLAGVKATWATAMLKQYPTVPPVMFTAAEFAIFKQKIKPMLMTSNLSELFEYIVTSWPTLRETKFKWLRAKGKDIALAPSLPELMRYWKVFAQAFADHKMVGANNAAGAVRTETDEVKDALAVEKAEKARIAAENARLRDELARTRQIAYAPRTALEAPPTRSLSERRRAVEGTYNESFDIPEWSSHDKGR